MVACRGTITLPRYFIFINVFGNEQGTVLFKTPPFTGQCIVFQFRNLSHQSKTKVFISLSMNLPLLGSTMHKEQEIRDSGSLGTSIFSIGFFGGFPVFESRDLRF